MERVDGGGFGSFWKRSGGDDIEGGDEKNRSHQTGGDIVELHQQRQLCFRILVLKNVRGGSTCKYSSM